MGHRGEKRVWNRISQFKAPQSLILERQALVFLLVNCVFGLKWLRRRCYEVFLALHVIGAALILAGTWYHRPITQSWVYAAVGIWVAERALRLLHHFVSLHGRRIAVRAPVVKAKASVVAGAIKLAVPARGQTWAAGQHCYISFWCAASLVTYCPILLNFPHADSRPASELCRGVDLAKQPWLYGPAQAHPFSIANAARGGEQDELRFVMRVHDGITSALARRIETRAKAASSSEIDCYVSLEGPHGTSGDPPPELSMYLSSRSPASLQVAALRLQISTGFSSSRAARVCFLHSSTADVRSS